MAHIDCRPPRGSSADWWFDPINAMTGGSTVQQLWSMSLPSGGICDITYDYVMATTEPVGTAQVVAAATAGTQYQRSAVANFSAVAPYNTI